MKKGFLKGRLRKMNSIKGIFINSLIPNLKKHQPYNDTKKTQNIRFTIFGGIFICQPIGIL